MPPDRRVPVHDQLFAIGELLAVVARQQISPAAIRVCLIMAMLRIAISQAATYSALWRPIPDDAIITPLSIRWWLAPPSNAPPSAIFRKPPQQGCRNNRGAQAVQLHNQHKLHDDQISEQENGEKGQVGDVPRRRA